MRILIIGGGGREHALAWKLRQSPRVTAVFIAPGNGGSAQEGSLVAIHDSEIDKLVAFARNERIDMVIPGPELPLTLGISDAMKEAGIACFGPSAWCAQLEGSKAFAKEIMLAAGVPTAASRTFTNAAAAKAYIDEQGCPLVIKADGLAAGKGVVIAHTQQEAFEAISAMMEHKAFGASGERVLIEEFLQGEEVSLLAFCSGLHAVPLPSAQDHKAVFDNDQGPNTGGMGAYSPAPILPDEQLAAMSHMVIEPILQEMHKRGHPFTGILYAGLMMTAKGPYVLEYNVRFGDPECQPLIMRLESDLVDIVEACLHGTLDTIALRINPQPALGVVVAAKGYPGTPESGMSIEGLAEAESVGDVKVFVSGAQMVDGTLTAKGGRVLCVTAKADTLAAAKTLAYQGITRLRMDKAHFRTDIGDKGLKALAR